MVKFSEKKSMLEKFHANVLNELRKLLLQNGYPAGVVNYNINDVLNRQQNKPRNPTTTFAKRKQS